MLSLARLGLGYAAEPPGRAAQVAVATSVADHIHAGDRARLAGRWAEAAVAYQAALQVAKAEGLPEEKRAPILGELGVCEEALGKHRDAAEHLDLALEQRNTLSPEQRRRFELAQSKAENQVSWLVISVDPPDAEVLVDGRAVGASKPSHIVFVEPGRHTVRARLAGHAEAVNSVDAPKARWSGVWLRLPRAPRTLSQAPSKTGPRARASTSSSAGAPASAARTWRTVGAATTVSLALLGTGFAIGDSVLDDEVEKRSSKIRELGGPSACGGQAYREDCEALHSIASARDVLNPLAVWTLLGAGVVGGVTLSSLWWAPAEQPRARARAQAQIRVIPTASARQAGAVLTATW